MKMSIVVLIVAIFTFPVTAGIIYVDANGTGDYPTIQTTINAANTGDQIILLPGIYTGNGNRDIDFLGKAITVQSTDPNNPNIVAATIIDCNGTEAEPHRGFYFHSNEGSNSILCGITITAGYYDEGGAIYCYQSSPTISNCRLINNYASMYGGALYGRWSNAAVTGCFIANNSVANTPDEAQYSGGGIYGSGRMIITNCAIIGNIASRGGGIQCGNNRSPIINNCKIIGNIASVGGGIATDSGMGIGSSPKITNCTFSGNIAQVGGAIYGGESSFVSIINSILWGNNASYGHEIAMANYDWGSSLSISYSNVQGGEADIAAGSRVVCHVDWGIGNINTEPCFVDPCNFDYHLKSEGWRWDADANQWTWDNVTSRCIDAGNPGYSLGDEPTTLHVDPLHRFGVNKRIDMGAYGGTAEASMPPYGWALLSDIDNSGKVDFADFYYFVNYYLQQGENLNSDLNRNGTVNLEDLNLIALDWLKSTDWAE